MIKTEILNPSLETIGEEIGQELGAKMVKDYQDSFPNGTQWYFIGKNIIEQILSQPDCVGIRFYNALNEEGQNTLVYVGIDKQSKIIVEYKVVDNQGVISTVPGIVADRIDTPGTGKGSISTTSNGWSSFLR